MKNYNPEKIKEYTIEMDNIITRLRVIESDPSIKEEVLKTDEIEKLTNRASEIEKEVSKMMFSK